MFVTEQIRRKDEEVRKALADKEGLVADLLSIPREDYQLIADIAGEVDAKGCTERDPAELVLAAVYQGEFLTYKIDTNHTSFPTVYHNMAFERNK